MNGYIGFYKGKRFETYAETSYAAQCKMAKENNVKEKDRYKIDVVLAEKNGETVVHIPTM